MTGWRRSLVACALGASALLPALPADAAHASSAQQEERPTDAVSALADCSTRTGRLAVVLLIDESASLRRTDPADRRVEAIQAALHGLSSAADRSATTEVPISIDVTMVGFGVSTTEVVGWTPLDGGTLPALLQEARNFADRDRQIDTDYAAAILGAQSSLAKLGSAPGQACSAVLWFTDGEYDIEPRRTGEVKPYAPDIPINGADAAAALEAAGKALLCDDGGVVDAVRSGGTEILAVALSSSISPADQDFLRAVAEGSGGASRCGAARTPDMPPAGAFLGTDDVSQLTARFFELVNGLAGGTQLPDGTDVPVCAVETCASGAHRFNVDPGIRSFNLLAVTSAGGIDVELRSPEGDGVLALAPAQSTGEGPLGSASAKWTWVATDAVLIEVTLPSDEGPWNGEWSVTFVDRTGASPGAVADAQIFVFGDVEPFVEATEFRAGETNEFLVGARHREGTPVNEALFAEVVLEAEIIDPADGTREPVQLAPASSREGLREGTWRAPAPDFPAVVNVSVTARITTISGQALAPVTRTSAVKVLPPSSYPTIDPTELNFDAITGTDPGTATITVVGGDASGGCIWLDEREVRQAPDGAGAVAITTDPPATSAETCLHVDAGESRQLQVSLSPEQAANGILSGAFGIALVSDTNPDVLRTTVTWSAPLQKPLDTEKAVKISLVLMAAGLLLPLLLMWLLNWITARFEAPSSLKVARLRATVTSNRAVFRTDGAHTGLAVDPSDFRALDGSSKTRSFDAGDLHFQSRVSLSPFSPPVGEVVSAGSAVASLPPPATGPSIGRAPVTFGLAGTAVVVIPLEALDAAVRADVPPRLSPDKGDQAETSYPDMQVDLVLFAPAGDLRRYAQHFNSHQSAVVAAVRGLADQRRAELDARRARDGEFEGGPATPDQPPRSPGTPGHEPMPPPPPRRGTSDKAPRGAAQPPERSAGGTPPPTRVKPNPAPVTPKDGGLPEEGSRNEPDPFGPPPGRRA